MGVCCGCSSKNSVVLRMQLSGVGEGKLPSRKGVVALS